MENKRKYTPPALTSRFGDYYQIIVPSIIRQIYGMLLAISQVNEPPNKCGLTKAIQQKLRRALRFSHSKKISYKRANSSDHLRYFIITYACMVREIAKKIKGACNFYHLIYTHVSYHQSVANWHVWQMF